MATPVFPRVLGVLTLAYGAYTFVRPESLLRAAGLQPPDGSTSRPGRTLGRLVGTRDVLSGLAMVAARPGPPLEAAVLVRVACDASDVVAFGLSVPRQSRVKVVAVAAAWGLVCAASYPSAGRST
jgi:hypothetical protein